ncbi:hypothetical protein Nepgr_016279 [Nepenthes gracilis]|uniref:DUF4283 domain-containing protein n=1 Tax=Nepenthes gracilis TaxID=150966 RepID=A0AAD3SN98_NEPGR|nr:hypothetical protein Nepgr_016279 [Nepenthes gracilis]
MGDQLGASIGSPLPISSHSPDSSLGLVAPSSCHVSSPYVTQLTWFRPERHAILPSAVLNEGPSSFKPDNFPPLPSARGPSGPSLSSLPVLSKDLSGQPFGLEADRDSGLCNLTAEPYFPHHGVVSPSTDSDLPSFLQISSSVSGKPVSCSEIKNSETVDGPSPSLWADIVKQDELFHNPFLKFYPPRKLEGGVASISPPSDVIIQDLPSRIRLCPQKISDVGLESLVEVTVVYQWKPVKCGNCQKFGHSSSKCKSFNLSHMNSPSAKEDTYNSSTILLVGVEAPCQWVGSDAQTAEPDMADVSPVSLEVHGDLVDPPLNAVLVEEEQFELGQENLNISSSRGATPICRSIAGSDVNYSNSFAALLEGAEAQC